MKLFNINELTPRQIAEWLDKIDGITATVAQKLSEYYQTNGKFNSKVELIDTLLELGVNKRYIPGIEQVVDVEKGIESDQEPIDSVYDDYEYEPGEEISLEDPIFVSNPPFSIPPNRKPPLLFVPGIMATALKNEKRGLFWPPDILDGISNIDLQQLKQDFNGPYEYVKDFVSPNAYGDLLIYLRKRGYTHLDAEPNLFIFFYDWTKSNKNNGEELVNFVQKSLESYNRRSGQKYEKMKCICHSMGGLIVRHAINKGAKIDTDKTAYIAVPHLGAPLAYFTLHSRIDRITWFTELFWDTFRYLKQFNSGIHPTKITKLPDEDDLNKFSSELALKFPSVFELLPDQEYLSKQRSGQKLLRIYFQPLSQSFSYPTDYVTAYKTGNYALRGSEPKDGPIDKNIDSAMDFKEKLGKIRGKPIVLWSFKSETQFQVNYTESINHFSDPKSLDIGDGTVPGYSGGSGAKVSGVRYQKIYEKYSHVRMPNTGKVHGYLNIHLNLDEIGSV